VGACVALAAPVNVTWSFPSFLTGRTGEQLVPTYLAHLFGAVPPAMAPSGVGLDLVCASATNTTGTAQRVDLSVRLPGFGADAARSVMLGVGATASACLNPGWNLDAIYALRSFVPGTVEAYASVGGTEISRTMRGLSMMPANGIVWSLGTDDRTMSPGLAAGTMATVFVTPNDPTVLDLQRAAGLRSAFPGGFGVVTFDSARARYSQADALYSRTLSLPTGTYPREPEMFFLEPGETMAWSISSLSGGAAGVDVLLLTQEQFATWTATGVLSPTQAWRASRSGSAGAFSEPEFTTGSWYRLVIVNPVGSAGSAMIGWARSNSRYDVAFDVLQAIFLELRTRGMTYVNISGAYFADAQLIRRPSESIMMRAANCIDGALLFASVIEVIGMEAVLVLVSGHAYVGVRSQPARTGAGFIWPIETTMVGSSMTPFAAVDCGNRSCVVPTPSVRRFIEVLDARARRILPLPR